ncbi:DNA topoisomerase [Fructobacillus evanidus]|uniref:DNA topoisomerase IA (TopA) n=1 Tax=Fructobacillus evanidus TaxID=3064281 RepID=A0ABN9YZL2_9LACO|nr:DNA topoisomerase IA (TopA) [Fructobacillus sp. LMG 32999]CAK1246964.1 DNA topoisomerase IA (TopA) [Fructobacillus sp. LMG 32999]
MTKYLILTEKPSARKNFEKALGGLTGHFANYDYELTNLRGHVMTLKEPQDQVPGNLKEKYESWQLKDLPWDLKDLSWKRTYLKSWNPRSKKMESTKKLVDDLKKKAATADALVIATDTDPSGEGDLLAWEAIDAIKWTGPVYRASFADESPKSLRKALNNLTAIEGKEQHGAYQKGLARNKWDFASMQLTRAATTLTRGEGYSIVSRQGRLKSAMLLKIYQQLQAIKNYVKVPYFEYRFKDENGNVFARKAPEKGEEVPFRYATKEALMAAESYQESSAVQQLSVTDKKTVPPKLLDLASLSAILSKEGFKAKAVLATYQKLYEAQIVSYPRTEDKTITPEQFQDMLPLVDQIAILVGIDQTLLTHRQPRPTHVKEEGAHGANRPGTKVPATLDSLNSFGDSAKRIYEVLAKNFLAMFAEDYHYQQIKGALQDYPDFITTLNLPTKLGWKAVYQDQDNDEEDKSSHGLGTMANLFIHEGQNSKPTAPTWKWLKTFLEKNNIGTGATRTSTYGELSSGKNAYIIDKKGKIDLTKDGRAVAIMAQNTWLADPRTTKRVFEIFDQVGRFEVSADQAMNSIVLTVNHDIPVIAENAKQLKGNLGAPKETKKQSKSPVKEKVTGLWRGKEVSFSSVFSGHKFTEQEIEDLLDDQRIAFKARSKKGKSFEVAGKLEVQTYKNSQFVGFKPEFK